MLQNVSEYNEALSLKVEIKDSETQEMACVVLSRIKQTKLMVSNSFDPIIKKAHEAHKQAITQRDEYMKPLDKTEAEIKKQLSIYMIEERRKKEEEQRIRLELIKKEEAERKKIIEETALKKAQELAEQNQNKQADEILTQADNKIEQIETVTKIQEEIINKPIIIIKPQTISTRTNYRFEIVDKSKIKPEFLIPDEVAIRKIVLAMKEGAEAIVGGIRVIKELGISSR